MKWVQTGTAQWANEIEIETGEEQIVVTGDEPDGWVVELGLDVLGGLGAPLKVDQHRVIEVVLGQSPVLRIGQVRFAEVPGASAESASDGRTSVPSEAGLIHDRFVHFRCRVAIFSQVGQVSMMAKLVHGRGRFPSVGNRDRYI
jgi:hypothetical protein